VYIVAVTVVWWLLFRPAIWVLVFGILAAVWPNWFSVLESMAKNRASGGGSLLRDDPFYLADMQQSFWWNDSLFMNGVEVALMVSLGFFLYKKFNNR
jgi:hypothetical protein